MKTTKLVIAEVLVLLLAVSTSSSSGQIRGDAGWDLADPINKAETRQFTVRLWAIHDGMTRQDAFIGFAFTNAPPSNLITLFTQAEELFNTLYSHRLHHDPFSETYYDLWDLVRDDACIREQFRSYATTGNLTVSSVCGSVASTKHALAVADGLTSSSEYTVAYAHVEPSGDLASTELQIKKDDPPPPPPAPDPTPPPAGPFKTFIECSAIQSLLPCMSQRDLYWPNDTSQPNPWPLVLPAFDCDDSVRAILRWLSIRISRAYDLSLVYSYLGVSWECYVCDANANCTWKLHSHALAVIGRVNEHGKQELYIIDGQTGQVLGPFDYELYVTNIDELIKQIINQLTGYTTCSGPSDPRRIHPPRKLPPDWTTIPDVTNP